MLTILKTPFATKGSTKSSRLHTDESRNPNLPQLRNTRSKGLSLRRQIDPPRFRDEFDSEPVPGNIKSHEGIRKSRRGRSFDARPPIRMAA